METIKDTATGIDIKDSGTRRDFGTGSVRDAATGKGRMDLLPTHAIEQLFRRHSIKPVLEEFPEVMAGAIIVSKRMLKTWAFRFAILHLSGKRDRPYIIGAAYFALCALHMRELPAVNAVSCAFGPVPMFALEQLSKLYEAGCQKYGDRNWEKGQPLATYMDSGLRHLMKDIRGDKDEDHLTAACWNFMCLIHTSYLIEMGLLPVDLLDGMPKPLNTEVRRSAETPASTVLSGIRDIAHTWCQAYPMPHGTRLTDMTTEDCLAAIRWKITSDHDIIHELHDENERRRNDIIRWVHRYEALQREMSNTKVSNGGAE